MTGETELRSIAHSGSKIYVSSSRGGQESSQIRYPAGFIFSINPYGTNYYIIKTFDYSTTALQNPKKIVVFNNSIYGVASWGNRDETNNFEGGVFKMNLNGSGFTRLAPFSSLNNGNTGKNPSGFIIHNGVLYGTNESGGTGGVGTLYSLSIGGGSGPPRLLPFPPHRKCMAPQPSPPRPSFPCLAQAEHALPATRSP